MQQQSIAGFRLSPQQRRLWVEQSMDEACYCVQCAIELAGSLEKKVLLRALRQVVARHESLRTTFRRFHAMKFPVQVIAAEPNLSWHVAHSSDDESLTEAAVEKFLQQERVRPFDVEHGPLLRFLLVSRSANSNLLIITLSALCADGFALTKMVAEISRHYEACLKDEDLRDEPIQFLQISEWQNDLLEAEGSEDGRAYWRGQSSAAVRPIRLPFEEGTGFEKVFAPRAVMLPIAPDVTAQLEILALGEGTSLAVVLLASWQVLLWRLTGQLPVTVGNVFDSRKYEEFNECIGPVSGWVPITFQWEANTSFKKFLRQVQDAVQDAFEWQDYFIPESFIPEPGPGSANGGGRETNNTAILFEYQPRDTKYSSTTLSWTIYKRYLCTDRFKIKLTCSRPEEALRTEFWYDTKIYDAENVRRIGGYYMTLLTSVVASPAAPVGELDILGEAERLLLPVRFKETAASDQAHKCIHQLFEKQAITVPDAYAIAYQDRRLTYAELNARANQLAHLLRRHAVEADSRVGVCLERSPELIIALLGILKAGGAYVPLDPEHPGTRLSRQLVEAQIETVVTEEKLLPLFAGFQGEIICLDSSRDLLEEQPETDLHSLTGPQNLAYVIYTSGSTGGPKGVGISHESLVNYTDYLCKVAFGKTNSGDGLHFATVSTLSADLGNTSIFCSLASGGCLHIISNDLATDGVKFASYVGKQGIDVLKIVPSHFSALLSEGGARVVPRKYLIFGGEILSCDLARRVQELRTECQLINHYGPTETTVGSLTFSLDDAEDRQTKTTAIPIGKPIANTEVYILDQHMKLLPPGVPGELYIGGLGLARGYLGQPEQTAQQFVPHQFAQAPGARLYKTGDLVRYRRDGNIEFLARTDHQVKIRGYRIELGEIEAALREHQAVREAVVVATNGSTAGSQLAAYIVPQQSVDRTELTGFLSGFLPNYMVPTSFSFLQALPLTPNGKIDRRALPTLNACEEGKDYVAPHTSTEQILAGIWSQVLGQERIGIHDNFFDLGGDSILGIQVISRATRAGLQLTTRQLLQHQTIANLALVASSTPVVEAEQGIVTGPVPLTPIQHRFFEQPTFAPHHYNQSVLLLVREALSATLLEEVVRSLLVHHDALRLRFHRDPLGWRQVNASPGSTPFLVMDLSDLSDAEQETFFETSTTEYQMSLNLSDGPLLRVVLFNLGVKKPARLLIIIHHLAVDGVSWRILLEDLQTSYEQLRRGGRITLPLKTTSFQRWSQGLIEYAQSGQLRPELSDWLAEARRRVPRLPVDHRAGDNTVASVRAVRVELSEEETRSLLQEVPATYQTQINDVLLTALIMSFKQWTRDQTLLIGLEGHGREEVLSDVDVTRTIGWFTSYFPLLLAVAETANEGEALREVKEQLREVKNQGIGYGVLRYLSADEQLASQLQSYPQPEVSFNYLGQSDQVLMESSMFTLANASTGPNRSPRSQRAHLLDIEGGIFKGTLQLTWSYSANLHRHATIESLAKDYLATLRRLIVYCRGGATIGYTPSDFPLARLAQGQLEELLRGERGIEDVYPLSPMQQGMLFHSVYGPESGDYVVQISCELHSDLKAAAFARAWQYVVNRHAILRTSFAWKGLAEPLQMVHRKMNFRVEQQDWRGLSQSEQRARLAEFLDADRARGFDLSQPTLMRVALIQLSDHLHHFVWSNHHLVIDGWCRPVILKEVGACYEAFSSGNEVCLEPVRQFHDYVAYLQQQDMLAAEKFWRRWLRGFRSPTQLSPDRQVRPAANVPARYREQYLQLTATETAALAGLARRQRLTLNTFVQGAWALLLGRHSGKDDVVFGVTVSGRPADLDGAESMIGLFINTLPVRVRMSPEDSSLSWLKALQEQQAEMRQYEYTPLIQVHGWSEVSRRLALFESMLVFNNYPVDDDLEKQTRSLGLLGYRSINWSTVYSRYPLIIVTGPSKQLSLRFIYDCTSFSDDTIARILEELKSLLIAMVERPEQQLTDLQTMSSRESSELPRTSNIHLSDEHEQFNFEF
jgi:amino acid adenylation domain-containing protein/non-ribosomal peptide synthase protein (TIGR01720 family)